jgi:hypothetical protein
VIYDKLSLIVKYGKRGWKQVRVSVRGRGKREREWVKIDGKRKRE